jgi:hypothetical protein
VALVGGEDRVLMGKPEGTMLNLKTCGDERTIL